MLNGIMKHNFPDALKYKKGSIHSIVRFEYDEVRVNCYDIQN